MKKLFGILAGALMIVGAGVSSLQGADVRVEYTPERGAIEHHLARLAQRAAALGLYHFYLSELERAEEHLENNRLSRAEFLTERVEADLDYLEENGLVSPIISYLEVVRSTDPTGMYRKHSIAINNIKNKIEARQTQLLRKVLGEPAHLIRRAWGKG